MNDSFYYNRDSYMLKEIVIILNEIMNTDNQPKTY